MCGSLLKDYFRRFVDLLKTDFSLDVLSSHVLATAFREAFLRYIRDFNIMIMQRGLLYLPAEKVRNLSEVNTRRFLIFDDIRLHDIFSEFVLDRIKVEDTFIKMTTSVLFLRRINFPGLKKP